MSMDYIRRTYAVAIKRGMRVEYCGRDNIRRPGRVCGSSDQYISVRLDGERRSRRVHPADPYLIFLPASSKRTDGG